MEITNLLQKITKAKNRQVSLCKHIEEEDLHTARKIHFCGSYLGFRDWTAHDVQTLRTANFCKLHWLCRACAYRRSMKMVSAYHKKLLELSSLVEEKGLIPFSATLTVANGHDLAERVAHLKDAWRRQSEAARSSLRKGKGAIVPKEWSKVAGGVRALEVSKNAETGQWHPHFHVFGFLSSYIDHEKWSREWLNLTGDSYVVGVSKVKGDPFLALLEVLKYTVKFSSLNDEELWFTYKVMKGSHCVFPFKCFRGVKVGDLDTDDETGLDGPYVDYVAKWVFGEGRFNIEKKRMKLEYPRRPRVVPPPYVHHKPKPSPGLGVNDPEMGEGDLPWYDALAPEKASCPYPGWEGAPSM